MVTLPEADYQAIRDSIYPVPGLSFAEGVGREYNGPPRPGCCSARWGR